MIIGERYKSIKTGYEVIVVDYDNYYVYLNIISTMMEYQERVEDFHKNYRKVEEDPIAPPPIGIMPEYIWKSKRVRDLSEAIKRYLNAGLKVNEEWFKEYNKLIDEK